MCRLAPITSSMSIINGSLVTSLYTHRCLRLLRLSFAVVSATGVMRLLVLLCSLAALSVVCPSAGARRVRPREDPTAICGRFLNITNCYYFACLDSIYRCGPGNILVQFSYRFCEATLEYTHRALTRAGQAWATAAQACVMWELNDMLKSKPTSKCTDIDRFVLAKYPVCLTQSHIVYSICSVICSNLQVFIDIFNGWNFANGHVKRVFLEASRLCQEQSHMENVIDVNRSDLRTILWSLCLDSSKVKLDNFQPNELMIRVSQRAGLFADYRGERK